MRGGEAGKSAPWEMLILSNMDKFCKNCIKSKRECAGYVQPLVYKQQQGLPAHDASSRSSISDGEFQFNEGFGGYTPMSHLGSFNPFLPSHDQFTSPQSYQYPTPGLQQSYGSPTYSFEAFRRHSFQDHNANLLGFGAASQPYPTGQQGVWPGRHADPTMSPHAGITPGAMGLSSTMMTSPGAFSESYASASSSHFPLDAPPLHGWYTPLYTVETS